MKVQIENPLPGSSRYTTINQATRYVRRGDAIWCGDKIRFPEPEERRYKRAVVAAISQERRNSDVYIRGAVLWNGSDTNGLHRPGEVRS